MSHFAAPQDEQLRDGLIQRFEFTYELSHRMLRRYLRSVAASPEAFDHMPFQDLIRTGKERGLLKGGWPAQRRYREIRSRISRAYAAAVAEQVAAGVPEFLAEAEYLRDKLRDRVR
jgi:nucleotidyltransferase substrate binding protein (TIGR01987 family)